MSAKKKVGLVLEGGGMKGMFTAGVLDFFLEQGFEFGEIIGVSAGAIHAASFLSGQKHRSRDITLKFIKDKRYCSVDSLLRTGDLFNAKFAYYDVPDKYFPFDRKTFKANKSKMVVVATGIETGRPEYFYVDNFDGDEVEILRASASIPMLSNDVEIGGRKYLDGGMSDSIPLKKIEADGFVKNVVVLTKSKGYRKRKSKSYLAMKKRYKMYPGIVEAVRVRHVEYNATVDYIEEQEAAGKILVLRPANDSVKRLEKNKDKLEALYNEGYETAKRMLPALRECLGFSS